MLSRSSASITLFATGLILYGALALPVALAGRPMDQSKSTAGKNPADADVIALGKKVYAAHGCATCHKINGQGGAMGPDLSRTGADPKHTRKWFEAQVTNPKRNNPASTMPAFGQQIKGKPLAALAAYLASLKGPRSASSGGGASAPPAKVAPPDPAIIAKIEQMGGRVGPIAQTDPRLEVSLRMVGNSLTDAALAPLSGLKNVIRLDLGHTGVTDAGLAHLKGWTDVTELHLEQTRITDRGLAFLKGMRQLTYLNLYGTNVTDAGLEHLRGLTNLKSLYVWQTKVTEAGANRLKQALPKVDVVLGWDSTPQK